MRAVDQPIRHLGDCHECGSVTMLTQSFLLRRHLDLRKPTSAPRAERQCPNSGTRKWSALDRRTEQAAAAAWGSTTREEATDGQDPR